jgi:hypothetical protein
VKRSKRYRIVASTIFFLAVAAILKEGPACQAEAFVNAYSAKDFSKPKLPVPGNGTALKLESSVSGETQPRIQSERNAVELSENYGNLPLRFEANEGQTVEAVKFLSRGPGFTLFLTATDTVMVLEDAEPSPSEDVLTRKFRSNQPLSDSAGELMLAAGKATVEKRSVLRMKLSGANTAATVVGRKPLAGTSNYFVGRDPSRWRTGIRNYAEVKYADVYPGVDLIYYGNGKKFEYDFNVASGADTRAIQMSIEGADDIGIDGDGNIVVKVSGRSVTMRKPQAYQEIGAVRREVAASYVLDRKSQHVSFDLVGFDANLPVIIDPVVEYSTYVGGSNSDIGFGIAVDAQGSSYIAGKTMSIDFPTTAGTVDTALRKSDAFVLKLSPDGSALEYATYLGGGADDWATGIGLDADGNAYITGQATSADFPTTAGAFQQQCPPTVNGFCSNSVFVSKLNPTGTALIYSTYLGGGLQSAGAAGFTRPGNIAVDAAGHAYVTGQTVASNFPTTPGAFQSSRSGSGDAFVTKLELDGSNVVYSTYLGGSTEDYGTGIAVDADGNAYVTGYTGYINGLNNFPTTAGAFQTQCGYRVPGVYCTVDVFVTKVNATGTGLVYSTFLGGTSEDWGEAGSAIVVDAAGSAYVTGRTSSNDFPVLNPPVELKVPLSAGSNAFITKFTPDGSSLVYSTYLAPGAGAAVAVNASGNAFIAGGSYSWVFPYVKQVPVNFQDPGNVFVMKLDATGSVLYYAITIGDGDAKGMALDTSGNAYVTGSASTAFPITNSLQPSSSNGGGAFVAKIVEPTKTADLTVWAISGKLEETATREIHEVYTITVHNYGPDDADRVILDESTELFYPTTLLSYFTPQGACANVTGRVMCKLGRIPAGQSVDVQWVVTTTSYDMPVTVRSATAEDPEPLDNSAALSSSDLFGRYIWVTNSLLRSGRVVSDPPGIDCADEWQTCQHYFEAGTKVTLTPIPNPGFMLLQWNGACAGAGTGPCTIEVTGRLRNGYIDVEPQFDVIPDMVSFTPAALLAAEVGVAFTQNPLFQGVPPYTVSVTYGALPSGLQINSGGQITGTPTTSGKFAFLLDIADQFGRSISQAFRMYILPALSITTSKLKTASVGKKYSAAVKTNGGVKPYTWSLAGGSLPAGLTIDSVTGLISGKPQQPGRYDLTVQVGDLFGGTVQRNFTLIIN